MQEVEDLAQENIDIGVHVRTNQNINADPHTDADQHTDTDPHTDTDQHTDADPRINTCVVDEVWFNRTYFKRK